MNVINKALIYAYKCHLGQKYNGEDYFTAHCKEVQLISLQYVGKYIPEEFQNSVHAGALCHDVMEDCGQSYNDVSKALGDDIAAEIVFALSHEKGRTREEKANRKYYVGIKNTSYATFVKLCDRIANVKASVKNKSKMLETYRREQYTFKEFLFDGEYILMWNELDNLLDVKVGI